jgi:threonine/homoserine/homoserine lactone efflux protein
MRLNTPVDAVGLKRKSPGERWLLQVKQWGRRIERVTGAVLVGLGIRLVFERR